MMTSASEHHQGLVRAQFFAACAVPFLFCVVGATAAAASGGSGEKGNKCETANNKISLSMDVNSKTVSFVCGSALPNLLPPKADGSNFDKCFGEESCMEAKAFSDLVGADVGLALAESADSQRGVTEKSYTVTVQTLPAEARRVYFQCGDKTAQETEAVAQKCTVEIVIPAKPSKDTCDEEGATITVEVNPTQKSAVFNCGGDLTSLQPATARVYRDDCTTEVSLEEELPSAKLTSENLRNTLSLSELPTAEKTLCYKCVDNVEKSSSSKQCTVKVKVPSSGSQSAAVQATASVLSVIIVAFIHF